MLLLLGRAAYPGYNGLSPQPSRSDIAMKIELTAQQEQAVKQGRPGEVVDPASDRAFVIMARELYERARPVLERGSPDGGPYPGSSLTVATVPEVKPLPQRLRDLPV